MRNQKVLRGFALIAVAMFFGMQAATAARMALPQTV